MIDACRIWSVLHSLVCVLRFWTGTWCLACVRKVLLTHSVTISDVGIEEIWLLQLGFGGMPNFCLSDSRSSIELRCHDPYSLLGFLLASLFLLRLRRAVVAL